MVLLPFMQIYHLIQINDTHNTWNFWKTHAFINLLSSVFRVDTSKNLQEIGSWLAEREQSSGSLVMGSLHQWESDL